jgi:Tfp pilus assembly protein PilZ
MSEQRRDERKKLMTFTPVYDKRSKALLGYLGDLTLEGAMVVGKAHEEINQHLTLTIEFHETVETPATRMTVPVRVAWCKPEDGQTYFHIGVEFLELTGENQLVIEAILERYQFRKEMPDYWALDSE